MVVKSSKGQKKRHGETVPCPSGIREHGWEGKMFPIYYISGYSPKIFNVFITISTFFQDPEEFRLF